MGAELVAREQDAVLGREQDAVARRVAGRVGDADAAGDVEDRAVRERLGAPDGERPAAGATQDVRGDLQRRGAPRVEEEVLRARVAALEPRLAERRVVVGVDEHAGARLLERRATPVWSASECVRTTASTSAGVKPMAARSASREPANPRSPASTAVSRPPSSTRYQLTISEPMRHTPSAIRSMTRSLRHRCVRARRFRGTFSA